MLTRIAIYAQVDQVSPDRGGLPLIDRLGGMVNGVAYVALLACVVGLLAGGGMLWVGSSSSNTRMQGQGKTAILASAAGAFVIGGAATVINFFAGAGS